MSLETRVNELLTAAVQAGDVAGVIATAGTREGVIFESAAGKRALDSEQAMTPDTVVFLASMTKALTATLAMQLVERGKLSLDAPAARVLPELENLQVLEGFDASGAPRLRPPRSAVTLRNLLTHTSGFSYEFWNPDMARWLESRGAGILAGSRASFDRPLSRDPDTAWDYSPGIDYAGRMVEAVSGERLGRFAQHNLFEPLGMTGTAFRITPAQRPRLAGMHARMDDGGIAPIPFELDQQAEFDMGGHGVYGTAPDYLRFLRMILSGGALDGTRVLQASTVAQMSQNQMGTLRTRELKTAAPAYTRDCDFYPGHPSQWGLSFMINTHDTAEGRSAGSLSWAGICNTYYWADLHRGIAGVLMTQLLPFFDARSLALFRSFEKAVNDECR